MRIFSKLLSCLILLLSAHVRAQIVTLSTGTQLTTRFISGDLQVQCSDSKAMYTYTCRDSILEPATYAYVIGPKDISADEVSLYSTRADGSRRSSVITYDAAKGRSTEAFNLWISTLFQRPLLKEGKNVVQYDFTHFGVSALKGTIEVLVSTGQARVCKPMMATVNESDCRSQFTNCQNYFLDQNYCK